MNDDLDISLPQGAPPDEQLILKIQEQMAASSATRVSPLPSNAVLLGTSLVIFGTVSVGVAAAVGFRAIPVLSSVEMALYYGVVAFFAVLFARAVTERMIPGEKRLISATALWVAVLALLSILLMLLFSDQDLSHFVRNGIPCLRLGLISASLSGLIGWRLLRRGYLVSPRETAVLYGFFAGLVGIAVLALHCPIRNSLHFLVWHLGAMVLAGIAGVFLGRFLENADG